MAVIDTQHYPNIVSNPDVQGGAAVLRDTRLPVRAIAFYWRETADKGRILQAYPQLTPEMLEEAIRYYEAHRTEIDDELKAEADVA